MVHQLIHFIVGPEVAANTRLVSFIRSEAGLTGTHYTCYQGGCGACVVTARVPGPGTTEKKIISINAVGFVVYLVLIWFDEYSKVPLPNSTEKKIISINAVGFIVCLVLIWEEYKKDHLHQCGWFHCLFSFLIWADEYLTLQLFKHETNNIDRNSALQSKISKLIAKS